MNDRAPIRDRALVLRILVPRLDQRLREKMKDVEEAIANKATATSATGSSSSSSSSHHSPTKSGSGSENNISNSLLDLEGVRCEPTENRNRTMWNFHCDGKVGGKRNPLHTTSNKNNCSNLSFLYYLLFRSARIF